jgi:radical SAM superfamily enzyme YgiQ (UPF0313 family)
MLQVSPAKGCSIMSADFNSGGAFPHILLIFPRFNPNSFWALTETCRVAQARAPSPPLGLMTVAAMLPQEWSFKLVNCNADTLTDADLDWADLVMTGGMLPQADHTVAIIERCRLRNVPVCVGGPDATSRPEIYEAADFLVLGEAETILDTFVAAWLRGDKGGRFEAEKFTADVTSTPIPRWDLIDFSHYLFIGMQFSRGCPFNCEFCDIIELYGRVPRTKTNPQILAELDRLMALGYRGHVDFVDDNLIGNKKALKKFLPELKAWQEARGYPFMFSTEASINLADDAELLAMMRDANFFVVFIGIESGDTETLIAMQKKQNTRRSLAESVHKIYDAGIYAIAGFIVGFDTERDNVAEAMVNTIESTDIPVAMVGLLTSLPNTQLSRRLAKEGRVLEGWEQSPDGSGDQCTCGLNFRTLRPRRDIMADYKNVLETIYPPDAYFGRLMRVSKALRRPRLAIKFNARHWLRNLRIFARLTVEITLRRPRMAIPFWRYVITTLATNPRAIEPTMMSVMMYLHLEHFTGFVVEEMGRRIAELDAGIDPTVPRSFSSQTGKSFPLVSGGTHAATVPTI